MNLFDIEISHTTTFDTYPYQDWWIQIVFSSPLPLRYWLDIDPVVFVFNSLFSLQPDFPDLFVSFTALATCTKPLSTIITSEWSYTKWKGMKVFTPCDVSLINMCLSGRSPFVYQIRISQARFGLMCHFIA